MTGHRLVDGYDAVLLDLDGVLYRGHDPVPHAAETVAAVRGCGVATGFVTNNAAHPPQDVARRLAAVGVPARPEEVVTSAQAAAALLRERLPPGTRVLVVGGEGLRAALAEVGLVAVDRDDELTEAVVQGFWPDLSWRTLAEGAYALARGAVWVAANTDLTIPTARGIAPGNGALVEVLSAVSGRTPEVAGKPRPPLMRAAIGRMRARHPLVVGDRLDTDVAGARAVGADSLLVLTGVTDVAEVLLAAEPLRPTVVGADLRRLLAVARTARRTRDGWRAGGWRAVVAGGTLEVSGAGDGDDAVAAGCAAAWEAADQGPPPDVTVAAARLRDLVGRPWGGAGGAQR